MGCSMSVKLDFLYSRLDFVKQNVSVFSEEDGERSYQNMELMEKRYIGRWDSAITEDCIRSLVRQGNSDHERKAR